MALISCVNRPSIQLCSSGAIVTVYPVGYIFTGEFLPGIVLRTKSIPTDTLYW